MLPDNICDHQIRDKRFSGELCLSAGRALSEHIIQKPGYFLNDSDPAATKSVGSRKLNETLDGIRLVGSQL